MNKKLLLEIAVILIASALIGIAYNFSKPKPLSLIYEKKKVDSVKSDDLFGANLEKLGKIKIEDIDGKTITFEQMNQIKDDDRFIIIDARNPENFNTNKIGNPINIFPYADENEVMNKILNLPHDKKIIVYCDGGDCDSSHKIAEILLSFGYNDVYIYTGGWEEWSKRKGLK